MFPNTLCIKSEEDVHGDRLQKAHVTRMQTEVNTHNQKLIIRKNQENKCDKTLYLKYLTDKYQLLHKDKKTVRSTNFFFFLIFFSEHYRKHDKNIKM